MDDLQYYRNLIRETKELHPLPKLRGRGFSDIIVEIERAHPWVVQGDEELFDLMTSGIPVPYVRIDAWTVLNARIELQLEDGTLYRIRSQPYDQPDGTPLGYLKLERSTA